MYTTGGLLHDPNRRDSILRAKRRGRERLAARWVMGLSSLIIVGAVGTVIYGALRGEGEVVRLAIGVIGAGGFLFGLGLLGLRSSLSVE